MQSLQLFLLVAVQTWASVIQVKNMQHEGVLRYELDTRKGKTISVAESGLLEDPVAVFHVLNIIIKGSGSIYSHQATRVGSRGASAGTNVPGLLQCWASRHHRVTCDQLGGVSLRISTTCLAGLKLPTLRRCRLDRTIGGFREVPRSRLSP